MSMAGWIRKSTPTLVQIIHCLVHHSSVVIQFVVGKALSGGHIMGHIILIYKLRPCAGIVDLIGWRQRSGLLCLVVVGGVVVP